MRHSKPVLYDKLIIERVKQVIIKNVGKFCKRLLPKLRLYLILSTYKYKAIFPFLSI